MWHIHSYDKDHSDITPGVHSMTEDPGILPGIMYNLMTEDYEIIPGIYDYCEGRR